MNDSLRAKRLSFLILFLTLLVSILAGLGLPKLRFDVELERYFPPEGEDMEVFDKYKKLFESTDSRVLIGLPFEGSVFDQERLYQLKAACDSIASMKSTRYVFALHNLNYPLIGAMGTAIELPFLDIEEPSGWKEDSLLMASSPGLVGTFVDSSFRHLSIQAVLDIDTLKAQKIDYAEEVRGVLGHFGFDEVYVGGKIIGEQQVVAKLKSEMVIFLVVAALLILVVLIAIYRNFWVIMPPVLVVLLTIIWLLGFMGWTGNNLDLLSSLIPTILFVIGISDSIHLHSRWQALRAEGHEKLEAIWLSIREVGLANAITSFTTAIGFLGLGISSIIPLRTFGLIVALGVCLAWLLSITLYPALLYLLPEAKGRPKNYNKWNSRLGRAFDFITERRRTFLYAMLLLGLLAGLSLPRLSIDNYLTEELPDGHEMKEGFAYFESHFSGIRSVEILIQTRESSQQMTDYEIVLQLEALENYLREEYKAGSVLGMATVVKQLNKASNGAEPEAAIIPDREGYRKLRSLLRSPLLGPRLREIWDKSSGHSRIICNIRDYGGKAMLDKDEKLLAYAAENCPDLELQLTGVAHLIDVNNKNLVMELFTGLGMAIFLISVLMGFWLRSVKLVLVVLWANLMPLMLAGLSMFLIGVDLKITTGLIFTISFGIAVDDTIHFFSKWKFLRGKGLGKKEALRKAFLSTSRAILLTSLILCSGFFPLTFSAFTSSHYLGLLVSLTLFYAVAIDLFGLVAVLDLSLSEKD